MPWGYRVGNPRGIAAGCPREPQINPMTNQKPNLLVRAKAPPPALQENSTMTEPAHELERYQLWTQLCASADHLQRLANDWLDLDPGVQRTHSERCNLDQLSLFEHGQMHHAQTASRDPEGRAPASPPSRPFRPPTGEQTTAAEAALLLRAIAAVEHNFRETHGEALTAPRGPRPNDGSR